MILPDRRSSWSCSGSCEQLWSRHGYYNIASFLFIWPQVVRYKWLNKQAKKIVSRARLLLIAIKINSCWGGWVGWCGWLWMGIDWRVWIGVYYIKLSFSGRTTSWILHKDPTWKRQLRISTPCVAMNLVDFDSLHRCSQCAPDYLTLISTAAIDIHCCDWCWSVWWRWNITMQEY